VAHDLAAQQADARDMRVSDERGTRSWAISADTKVPNLALRASARWRELAANVGGVSGIQKPNTNRELCFRA
jgi:hypothetical protein